MDEEQRRKLMEGYVNDTEARRAEQEALRKKREQESAERTEGAQAVQQGVTTLSRMQSSQAANERTMRREGMDNLGRNPEEIVIGKRTDWDPNILNQKPK
jgi:hypothetical protein